MAEQKRKFRLGRFFGFILKTLLTLLAMAAVYVIAVVARMPGVREAESYVVVEEDPAPLTRMQSASMDSAQGLAQLFGAPLPSLSGGAVSGEGFNTSHDGEDVRMAVLRYEGLVITAVQPASAAPLLKRDELTVSLRSDLTVLSMPAVLAKKDDAYCVYFTNASAAYSVYAAHADDDAFFTALDSLTWAQ